MTGSLIPAPLADDMTDYERRRTEATQLYETLTVRRIGVWLHTCESGRHKAHAGDTCDEVDAWLHAQDAWMRQVVDDFNRWLITGRSAAQPVGLSAALDTLAAEPTPAHKAMAILAPDLARDPRYRP